MSWVPGPLAWPDAPLTDGVVTVDGLTDADAADLAAGADDQEISRWLGLPLPYTVQDALTFLLIARRDADRGDALTGALRTADGLVGCVGLHLGRCRTGEAEIGYWVAARARGRGIASRATRLLAWHAFQEWRPRRVELLIDPDNAPSLRVAARAGARYEGVRRAGSKVRGTITDAAVYAFVPSDLDGPAGPGGSGEPGSGGSGGPAGSGASAGPGSGGSGGPAGSGGPGGPAGSGASGGPAGSGGSGGSGGPG